MSTMTPSNICAPHFLFMMPWPGCSSSQPFSQRFRNHTHHQRAGTRTTHTHTHTPSASRNTHHTHTHTHTPSASRHMHAHWCAYTYAHCKLTCVTACSKSSRRKLVMILQTNGWSHGLSKLPQTYTHTHTDNPSLPQFKSWKAPQVQSRSRSNYTLG